MVDKNLYIAINDANLSRQHARFQLVDDGDFRARLDAAHDDLQRYPFHNVTKGGLNWSGDGRGCNRLTGWFVIDRVTYSDSTLTAIDLRFEQRCDDRLPYGDLEPALRGPMVAVGIHGIADAVIERVADHAAKADAFGITTQKGFRKDRQGGTVGGHALQDGGGFFYTAGRVKRDGRRLDNSNFAHN